VALIREETAETDERGHAHRRLVEEDEYLATDFLGSLAGRCSDAAR
jgi:hypothetical protein